MREKERKKKMHEENCVGCPDLTEDDEGNLLCKSEMKTTNPTNGLDRIK